MKHVIDRERKMQEIFETAQKMKKDETSCAKSFDSIASFIEYIKTG